MATVQRVEVVSPEGRSTVLKQGSFGISSVFCCIATAAELMTALLFNVPVIVSGITARVLGVFFVAEVTVAVVFSIAVLVQGDADGLTAAPLIQALTSFAIVRYFWLAAPAHRHPVKTLLAPLFGGALMVFSAWLLFHNRGALSGAGGAAFVKYGFWVIVAAFVVGLGGALWFRTRDQARYAAAGRFVHEEA